jgi:hypothetical protein
MTLAREIFGVIRQHVVGVYGLVRKIEGPERVLADRIAVIAILTRRAGVGVGIRLLVALEVVPLSENDPPKRVNYGRKVARWCVVEQRQVAVGGVKVRTPVVVGSNPYSSRCGYSWAWPFRGRSEVKMILWSEP